MTPNTMNTLSIQLLERFSSSLLSAEYSSVADAPPNLHTFRRRVETSFNVLKALQENADSTFATRDTSPVRRKKSKGGANHRRIDPLLLDSMGITVPTTDAEVRDVCIRILSQLRGMLEVCGSRADSLYVGLNDPRIISSFSESRHYQR